MNMQIHNSLKVIAISGLLLTAACSEAETEKEIPRINQNQALHGLTILPKPLVSIDMDFIPADQQAGFKEATEGFFVELAEEVGLKVSNQNFLEDGRGLSLELKTAGNGSAFLAATVQITIIEPVEVSRNGKKYELVTETKGLEAMAIAPSTEVMPEIEKLIVGLLSSLKEQMEAANAAKL